MPANVQSIEDLAAPPDIEEHDEGCVHQWDNLTFKKNSPNPQSVLESINLTYYRFCLLTGSQMLDPWERTVFSIVTR